ncbi:MAG: universal stress protein [Alphaproteobacteria bacterium]
MTTKATPDAGSNKDVAGSARGRSNFRKFLVVADTSPEARLAVHFASRRALATNARVTLLSVLSPADFQHWMTVGELMREEARQDAESALHDLAGEVNRLSSLFPELVIKEGTAQEAVTELIEEDPDIRIMVLGASSHKEGPGPLVTAAANCAFPIPVTIVPGNLTPADIEELA